MPFKFGCLIGKMAFSGPQAEPVTAAAAQVQWQVVAQLVGPQAFSNL